VPPTYRPPQLVRGTFWTQQWVHGTFWILAVLALSGFANAQVVQPAQSINPSATNGGGRDYRPLRLGGQSGLDPSRGNNRLGDMGQTGSSANSSVPENRAGQGASLEKRNAATSSSDQKPDARIEKDSAFESDSGKGENAANQPPNRSEGNDASSGNMSSNGERVQAVQGERLLLSDVMASLYRSYPIILAARLESSRTRGELVAAYGSFDTKLYGSSIAEPTGFYRNYRSGLGVARQTWWGGYLSAGYRLGRGVYQPWYLERETEKGGEFKVGWTQPLLQGRAIDANRVAIFQASLAQQAAAPIQQQAILDAAREAANFYWDWLAAGAMYEAQRELLALAEERGEKFEDGFKAGKFAEIDVILNRQLIAERKSKVIESEQKYRATTFKLSLFLRDEQGQPMIPDDQWLPEHFPIIETPPVGDYQTDLGNALARRPEPRLLQLEIQQVNLDRRLAQNDLLPALDFISETSQDIGQPGSKSNDKGEFELVVGVQGEVPIQRRKARGKIQSTSAKIAQIEEKLRLQRDKIGVELQTTYNALQLSTRIVEQAEVSLRAAFESLDRYRFAFERGKADLIYLNLLETKANETEIKLVDAQRSWFSSLANMQAALGLDPLDQAVQVSSLPFSERPGPGNLPTINSPDPEVLNRDWKLHSTPRE
jgi:outer membrane protein TolC